MEKEIYKTLIYGDIFDYPLTGNQIFQTTGVKVSRKKFLTNLKKIPHTISHNLLYYFLPKREETVGMRKQREKYSLAKIEEVKKIIPFLALIPTIRFIGVSGSVAILNADKKSDIDLFFITAPNSVWITRLLVYVLLQILGLRRQKGVYKAGSICANMFIDEEHQCFLPQKRNLYLAHEIVQLFPVLNRNHAYEIFLSTNIWIQNYFPNFFIKKIRRARKTFFPRFLLPVEFILRKVQLWYMEKNKTRETTTPFVIAFHPIDYEKIVLDLYTQKLKKYGI